MLYTVGKVLKFADKLTRVQECLEEQIRTIISDNDYDEITGLSYSNIKSRKQCFLILL